MTWWHRNSFTSHSSIRVYWYNCTATAFTAMKCYFWYDMAFTTILRNGNIVSNNKQFMIMRFQSGNIREYAYFSNWEKSGRYAHRIKVALMMTMCRSLRACRLTAGKFAGVDLPTFLAVCRFRNGFIVEEMGNGRIQINLFYQTLATAHSIQLYSYLFVRICRCSRPRTLTTPFWLTTIQRKRIESTAFAEKLQRNIIKERTMQWKKKTLYESEHTISHRFNRHK